MSQTNRNYPPQFQYSVQGPSFSFDDQVSQLNPTQPWLPSGPRSVQYQARSPSTSVRTDRTAPDPRPFNRPGYHHTNRSPIDNNIDPQLNDWLMLDPSYPIERLLQERKEQPWSIGNLRDSNTIGGRSPLAQPNVQYGTYRGALGSDIDPSDSGYHSQRPPSVFSNEPNRGGQELPSSITHKVGTLNVESALSEVPTLAPMPVDQVSQVSSRSGKSGKPLLCPECGETQKTKSDLKKHKLRHDKPFKCDVLKCKRAEKGFTTVNDLDRHKKSVHGIDLQKTKSYKCASENCRNKEKVWPRLDNFKQHVERMHKEEDELELIKRSVYKESAPSMESISEVPVETDLIVAPMDTNHAVSGMEKSFSGNPAMDSGPMIELLDRDPRPWPASGPKPDDFAQDMFQGANHPMGLVTESEFMQLHGNGNLHPESYIYPRASGAIMRREPKTMHTNTEDQVLSTQPRPESQNLKPRPSLSNAPQTKAEQQRSAFQKQSRTTAKSSTSDPVNIEEVLSIIQKATESTGWDKSEALKVSQAISTLMKQSPGSGHVIQRRSTHESPSNPKICPKCSYAVARDCDLRKHMKRHEKPYGCTYPKCYKRFGAKSDWKRHENSQHFQAEAFRCARPLSSSSVTKCGEHFFRENLFEDHLKKVHKLTDSTQKRKEIELCKIGKNCQVRFWCGFCTEVRELKQRQNAAWDERFDHIAHHFEKERKSIDDWVCFEEENRTKKESWKELNRGVLEGDEDRDMDAEGEDDDEALPASSGVPFETSTLQPASPLPQLQVASQGSSRKRKASAEPTAQGKAAKQRMTAVPPTTLTAPTLITRTYCCNCEDGPFSSFVTACVKCPHNLCNNCPMEQAFEY